MDKSQRIYIKALNKYNNGYINRAIKLCEESISIDIKNKSSINLKGLLLYLTGNLDDAQKLWKMNYQVNDDDVAQKYLENSKQDNEKIKFYKQSLVLIEKLEIDKALVLLEKCSKSDFNYINVNNYSSLCYIKKGNYIKALEKANNVLKLDVKNVEAKKNIKFLKSINVIDNKTNVKKFCFIFFIGIIIVGILFLFVDRGNRFTTGMRKLSGTWNTKQSVNSKSYNKEVYNANGKIASTKIFPSKDMEKYLNNKDYDSIYVQVMDWRNEKLNSSEEDLLFKAYQLLTTEGCVYFYNLGCNYLNNKDYNNAKAYLKKAYEFGTGNELYPYIIYMLGSSFDLSGDLKSSIKYYEEYDHSFSSGNYEEVVLYRLAIIYKDINMIQSKNYAQKLVNTYPQSSYINSEINNLIN